MAKIQKEDAQKWLAPVPEQYAFWRCDGQSIRDMTQLASELDTMSDEIFEYHSNKQRKDFSNWVRDVIGDQKLANDLKKAPNRYQAGRAVRQRLSFLSDKL